MCFISDNYVAPLTCNGLLGNQGAELFRYISCQLRCYHNDERTRKGSRELRAAGLEIILI